MASPKEEQRAFYGPAFSAVAFATDRSGARADGRLECSRNPAAMVWNASAPAPLGSRGLSGPVQPSAPGAAVSPESRRALTPARASERVQSVA